MLMVTYLCKSGDTILSNLLIICAGGYGSVVAEAAELMGMLEQIAFLDDRTDVSCVLGFKIIGTLCDYINFVDEFEFVVVSIGNNEKRLEWPDIVASASFMIPMIIHTNRCVSKYCLIGEGSVVLAGSVVESGTYLECLIKTISNELNLTGS